MTKTFNINTVSLAVSAGAASVVVSDNEVSFAMPEELEAIVTGGLISKADLVSVYNQLSGKAPIKNFKSIAEGARRTFEVIKTATPSVKFSILRDFAEVYMGGVCKLPFVPVNQRAYRVNPLPYIFG